MTTPVPEKIRSIAIIAHGGAGKATLIESMLFQCRAIQSRGSTDKGNAAMLVEPEEASRKIAITPHVSCFTSNDVTVYLVDCPGYFNFQESTRAVLAGVDGAVVLLSGIDGVRPETERLWSMVQEAQLPAIGFVNQMDDEQANFSQAMATVNDTLKIPAQPIFLPIGSGKTLSGMVDLIRQKARSTTDGKTSEIPVPPGMQDEVKKMRSQLIDKIAEANDDLIEKYLEGAELSEEELDRGLKEALIKRTFMPVLAGSALTTVGVDALIESIVRCLPSPLEREKTRPISGFSPADLSRELKRSPTAEAPFSAIVLKTTIDPFSGKLSVVRVFSGQVKSNQAVMNTSRQAKQKVGHGFLIQGKELTQQPEGLFAGQIGALSKLDETKTGDTICDPDQPIVFPAVKFSDPPVSYAVESDGKTDEKVAAGLIKLMEEDPTIRFYREDQTHEMILAGMGQTHIEVTLERLARKFGGKAKLNTPRVPYKETIRKTVKAQGKLKKQTGGHGQFANCWLEVGPLPRGSGFQFIDQIVGGIIPKQFIPSIQKGVNEAMSKGLLAGFPVVDVKVAVYDGSFHDVDSSDYAFQVAGSLGFKAAFEQAGPVLLEPIMSMKVIVPEENTGDVLKDLSSRRGRVASLNSKGSTQEIDVEAPLAEILEYGNILSALTSGRGAYTMSLSAYREVPAQLQEKILEANKVEQEKTE